MISVEEALARILANARVKGSETITLRDAAEDVGGRILATAVKAERDQPPFAASAMDGYAVRSCDLAGDATALRVVGEAAAGHGYRGTLGPQEAVRIFTGAAVPSGADAILIQEKASRAGDIIRTEERLATGTYIRPAGLDFAAGETLLDAYRPLDSSALSVLAAAGYADVDVIKRPKVALLATGDELVAPGGALGPDQIFASNQIGIAAEIRRAGGVPLDLGIAPDNRQEIANRIIAAQEDGADIIVTLGGASVGEHDFVGRSLADVGMRLDFWKIAMRPGKPLMHGHLGDTSILGLPGNPVSGLVCTQLFLVPLIRRLLGQQDLCRPRLDAICRGGLPANNRREAYLRAIATSDPGGSLTATPFANQDSSLLKVFASANALILRAPFAPALKDGDRCQVIML